MPTSRSASTTGAAAAYVSMTRGRENTAHLVAESVEDARKQWMAVFAPATAPTSARHTPDAKPSTRQVNGSRHRGPLPEHRPPSPASGVALGL